MNLVNDDGFIQVIDFCSTIYNNLCFLFKKLHGPRHHLRANEK